jgi:hypothetical protein
VATSKTAAQAIRKISDIGWKPTHYLASVGASVSSTLVPADVEKSVGIISAAYAKDFWLSKFRLTSGLEQRRDSPLVADSDGTKVAPQRGHWLGHRIFQCRLTVRRREYVRPARSGPPGPFRNPVVRGDALIYPSRAYGGRRLSKKSLERNLTVLDSAFAVLRGSAEGPTYF